MAPPASNLAEILDGLQQDEKSISPKYFYDERGSQLFDEITQLPEYYLTDTEMGIMLDEVKTSGDDGYRNIVSALVMSSEFLFLQ